MYVTKHMCYQTVKQRINLSELTSETQTWAINNDECPWYSVSWNE